MSKQVIISIGREFGSGGRAIASALAQRFSLPLYEKNILSTIAESRGLDSALLQRYDEAPNKPLIYRTVNGFNNAPGDALAQMQFRYLRDHAAAGESFVVLGRCAEEVLKDFPGLISIFVLADLEFKKGRVMAHGPISESDALTLMVQRDRKRKTYHNQYCKGKWGDSRCYDLSINSAPLDIQGTTDFLEQYIRIRMAVRDASPL